MFVHGQFHDIRLRPDPTGRVVPENVEQFGIDVECGARIVRIQYQPFVEEPHVEGQQRVTTPKGAGDTQRGTVPAAVWGSVW